MATERLPLSQPIESRVGNFLKDSRSVNCVFEKRDQKREFIKRPGLVTATQVVAITPPAETPSQGLASFNNKIISVINNTVYSTSPTTPYATTTVGSIVGTISRSYFVRTFLDAYLFLHNKTNGYLYSQAGVFSGITNDKVVSVSIDNSGAGYSSGITLTPGRTGVSIGTATQLASSSTQTISNISFGTTATITDFLKARLTVAGITLTVPNLAGTYALGAATMTALATALTSALNFANGGGADLTVTATSVTPTTGSLVITSTSLALLSNFALLATTATGGVVLTPTVDITGHITAVAITNAGSGMTAAPSTIVNIPPVAIPTGTGTKAFFTIVVSSAAGIYTGMSVTGTGIAPNAIVTSISSTTITLSIANADTVSGNITFVDMGSSAALTALLSAFPAGPYVAGAVFLDNYVFIGTTNNRIYNSEVGDPTSWNALNFLTFEQTTDTLVGIIKHLNYLVAFGQTSMQFFYDNANPTGSPLAVSQSYTNEIGCINGDTIASTDNTVLWVGTSKSHGRAVYLLDGVSPVKVSSDNIDKHLEAADLNRVSSFVYKFSGHTLYLLALHSSNETLVYDINEKTWYQWTQYSMMSNDQPNPGTWVESYFRPTYYAEVLSVPFVLDDDTATIYYFDVNTYQDAGQPIYCRTVTDIADNGSTKRKFYGRLEIIGDKVAGTLQVRHSGDDYNTWSSYRSIDLNASRSQIYLSGADRRRAWEFLCTSNVPLRLDGAEIDFRIGELDQEQGTGGGRYRS